MLVEDTKSAAHYTFDITFKKHAMLWNTCH